MAACVSLMSVELQLFLEWIDDAFVPPRILADPLRWATHIPTVEEFYEETKERVQHVHRVARRQRRQLDGLVRSSQEALDWLLSLCS